MPGPWGFPWSTFVALVVIAGSVVVAIVFAAMKAGRSGKGDRDE